MKSIRVAVVIITGLIVALWWAAMPPVFPPKAGGAIDRSGQRQCPANSRLEGKLCVCPSGMVWSGASCTQVLTSSARSIVSERVARVAPDSSLQFARVQVPTLPYNLNTWPNKIKAINSSVPAAGSVAMIDMPGGRNQGAGHVAIVEAVGENSLTIIEGNYELGSVTRRTATGKDLQDAARQLRIVGYYKP
ncbi:MAG: CHAP domain-containing protein [Pseudomonadota bacterium]